MTLWSLAQFWRIATVAVLSYRSAGSQGCDNQDEAMTDVISEYQRWKQQGESLRTQAKEAMESRFRELLSEAVRIAEEYRADFGVPLKPATPVTAFRYKTSAKVKARKAGKKPVTKLPEPAPKLPEPVSKPREEKGNPKVAGLEKRLATAKKKLDAARAAGKPTRTFEDQLYEIEDELRLAMQAHA